jgi:transcriptional regulator with XRE-family HTH domain
MSRVGDKIRNLRLAKGMTEKQLGKALGVNEKFISDIEAGRRVLNDELFRKVSRVLEQEINEIELYSESAGKVDEGAGKAETPKKIRQQPKAEVQDIWNEAFESVLKAVPVYDSSMSKVLSTRQLPIVSNRVEGHPKEKVVFLEIQDNDMIGFRMMNGDTALAYMTQELENNGIYLVEYNGQKVIRQIKKLDASKLLLLSNDGRLQTQTAPIREVKLLAKLDKLEIKL